jgi:hypothetical protein
MLGQISPDFIWANVQYDPSGKPTDANRDNYRKFRRLCREHAVETNETSWQIAVTRFVAAVVSGWRRGAKKVRMSATKTNVDAQVPTAFDLS